MLTLYYSRRVCSMASHIGLEETGAPYEKRPTLLPKGEHKSEAYLKVNPKGKVPALDVDGKVITENTAILTYLGRRFADKKLLPTDPIEEASDRDAGLVLEFSAPALHALRAPERYVEGEPAQASVKETGKKTFMAACTDIDGMLQGKQWIAGSHYTVADGYAMVFYGWGLRAGLPMKDLKAFTALKDRVDCAPAVRRVLESEESVC